MPTPVAPAALTAAGLSPDRADRATFVARSIARDDFIKNTQIPELQASITNVYNNSLEAFNSGVSAAANAASSATNASQAAAASAATQWVSGTNYVVGDARWSPITKISYRRIIAGAGTTDPSADATNWGTIILPVAAGGTGGTTAPTARTGLGATAVGDAVFIAANAATARAALGVPDGVGKNKLINPNFAINQRVVTGTVTLGAGAYGHDRFKAGAGGCTYTFATAQNVTTITISAGTLLQIIEGVNLLSGTHTLSWVGTATARIDTGAFGASGITGTAVGGTNQTCEWGTGTVSKTQYEPGALATTFEHRLIPQDLSLCQRYLYAYTCGAASGDFGIGYMRGTTSFVFSVKMPVSLRIIPTTLSFSGVVGDYSYQAGGTTFAVNAISAIAFGIDSSSIEATSATASTVGFGGRLFGNAGARTLFFGAEL